MGELIFDFGKDEISAATFLEGFIKIYFTIKNLGSAKDRNEYFRLYDLKNNMYVAYNHFKRKTVSLNKILKDAYFPNRGFVDIFFKYTLENGWNPDKVKCIYSYGIKNLMETDSEWSAVKWADEIDVVDVVDFDGIPSNEDRKEWISRGYRIERKRNYLNKTRHPFKNFPFAITLGDNLDHEQVKKYWELNGSIVRKSLESLRIFDQEENLEFAYGPKRILFDID